MCAIGSCGAFRWRFPFSFRAGCCGWEAITASRRTGLLEAYYQSELYGDTCLFQLPEQPYLHILSTNLTEGALCSFTRDGVIVQRRLPGEFYRFERMHTGLATLALAVTASSAFPGFFPPLQVDWADIGAVEGQFNRQVFTDGGVFDNLGVRMFRNLERTWLGRESELSRRDFYDARCVVAALSSIDNVDKNSPVARLAQLYSENAESNGQPADPTANDDVDQVVANLQRVVAQSTLYREPAFQEVKPDDPEAVALLHSVRDSGKDLEYHDHHWLNRQLLETVLRQITGKRCMRPLGAMFDQVLVSDAGKHLRAITEVHAMGMITTAMRASDIGLDRVWQLEKETFRNQPGFMFLPISRIVELSEDPTAPHPEIQRRMQEIRTDMDQFTPLEISTLVRHGYCVARAICRERHDWTGQDWPTGPPWDPDEDAANRATRGAKKKLALLTGNRGPTEDVIAARKLQASALRNVWARLLDWRDWTSYVYVALILVILSVGPVGIYRLLVARREYRETQKLTESIARTDQDQLAVLRLLRDGTVAPWKTGPVDEVTSLLPATETGIKFNTDHTILDPRKIDMRESANNPGKNSIYARRRVRFQKTSDLDKDQPFVYRFTVPAVSLEIRVLNRELHPRLRRLKKSPETEGGLESNWELQLDLTTVPLGEPVDLVIEILMEDPLPGDFERDPRVRLIVNAPVAELVAYVLLPENRQFDHFRLVALDPRHLDTSRVVTPTEGLEYNRGSIIHWSLLAPAPGTIYECHWNWVQ